MFATQLIATTRAARRAVPTAGLVATLLAATLPAPIPTFAGAQVINDHRNGGPPSARVQVVLKSVHVLNDRDWGDGEMDFSYSLICHQALTPCQGAGSVALDGYGRRFNAGSGDTIPFNEFLPRYGAEVNPHYDATSETGYPLRSGQEYELRFRMQEKDGVSSDEDMGEVKLWLTEGDGWGVGTHRARSVRGGGSGDYEVEVEVRRMPFPDLRPVGMTVADLPDRPEKRVCVAVQNVEVGGAGPFEVALRVDGVIPTNARSLAQGLDSGVQGDVCMDAELGAPGQRKLEAIVDGMNALVEFNEANNVYEQAYTVAATQATPAPQASPTPRGTATPLNSEAPDADGPDLIVSAIEINGQAPDGKGDCKNGKNDVAVVVKNQGEAPADPFVVRLTIDGGSAATRTLRGVDPGREREVRVSEVRMTGGQHTLAVTVDAEGAVAERDEDNNARTFAVRCDAKD
jgi:hypothetical protein